MLELKDFKRVLNHSDGSDLLEQLKKWLHTEDCGAYQKWKEEGFDINHRFIFYQLDQYNINELTLLQIAAEYSNEKVVEALLEAGADVNNQDRYGNTPLHRSVRSSLEVVKALLKAGADVNKQNRCGEIPLHRAVHGSLEVVKALLKAGADVNSQDIHGRTPLYKDKLFNKKAAQVLLEAGADPTLGDKNGKTTNDIAQQEANGGVIAGLAIGLGLYFGTSAALTVLPTIIGIALVAALLVGATICSITYDVLKPKSCVDTVYVCKGFDTIKQEANIAASMVV
ncbi:ankyrin repeat domain-containing protein [Wolbachia endosymbiont of Encarsia formosa]|uniref:ankyrin repeat domain-containing protein n=1 Tax=Wolbachia endosymbiont of Encarsia formosa TaxID=77125 RepID=UPI0031BB0072